ncbi:MAG: bifunctional methylenetetrahydrofolate dehydrogenase/methenyltetrahydrofolate cyclohydrolase FolD [Chloroflexi bacterium]|jgi:methylenetetrahydrofolate dehydrogenase (NADP+) / methenyltetrahydrofolate cyclohydrolase|nr:bifunctional methylenetetrahydrofolate dehydrogenase/methenyltetrahydrofolate cyclohydrolase FolD [Chloroflexota bacterium]MBT3670673.1 bifunctional methylenetetrahydrofolate dehydrogenase/methenyltetrahydrofolate cyclohydrolase FolD [Chloroflexota bacterium]MBT4002668.1 bifunctional methylenetetrahydrofolate dehydrogenase/methenyltetrahydrofolate cyclohydrolase FolD [Chloroflexota bacterium]MBT4306291.1 bifunctional methylenetetrahydrofolate dehydrogenase/methenyltetrahydrofolate cyclohydrol
MTANIINGKEIAKDVRREVKEAVEERVATGKSVPGLATVLVGSDPASGMYVKMKQRACNKAGINAFHIDLPADTSQEELEAKVAELNADENVHGILVQLPLPDGLDEERVLQAIDVNKDVDGFHPLNIGRLAQKGRTPVFMPATPAGCIELLKRTGVELEGANAVVLGRSNIVGMPVALMLVEHNATVTICHSRTKDLKGLIQTADVLVCAVGRPEMVKGDWIKPGAVVIDVATVKVDAPELEKGYKWVGDVAFDEAMEVASAITPVPGGVGPMTIAILLQNTLKAAQLAD